MNEWAGANGYATDVNHVIASVFVAGHGMRHVRDQRTSDREYLFPDLGQMTANGPANHITSIIKNLAKSSSPSKTQRKFLPFVVKELRSSDATGTGLRIGAANAIVSHASCSIAHALMRGNWECTDICVLFHYLLHLSVLIDVAGKALAGWTDARQKVFSPRLDVVRNDTNSKDVDAFMCDVLNLSSAGDKFGPEGRLRPFAKAMLASLIMYWNDFVADQKDSHFIISAMVENAMKNNISRTNLESWSREIKGDFDLRNLPARVPGGQGGQSTQLAAQVS
jgi:hypothetical protein